MRSNIEDINGWLYHRIRMCIWKQWKLPRTNDIVNIGLHFFLKDVRPMLPPVMNRSIVDA